MITIQKSQDETSYRGPLKDKSISFLIANPNVSKDYSSFREIRGKNDLLPEINSSIQDIKQLPKIKLNLKIPSQRNFCPMCEHCNKMEDEKLDQYIFSVRESKNILSRSLEYILESEFNKKSLDFLMEDKEPEKVNNEQDICNNLINGSKFNLRYSNENFHNFITNFPKQINQDIMNYRQTYKILAHYLNALVENRIAVENLVSKDLAEKFNNSLISKGTVFDEFNGKVFFDAELEELFDGRTKEIIKTLFRSKFKLTFRKVSNLN